MIRMFDILRALFGCCNILKKFILMFTQATRCVNSYEKEFRVIQFRRNMFSLYHNYHQSSLFILH